MQVIGLNLSNKTLISFGFSTNSYPSISIKGIGNDSDFSKFTSCVTLTSIPANISSEPKSAISIID